MSVGAFGRNTSGVLISREQILSRLGGSGVKIAEHHDRPFGNRPGVCVLRERDGRGAP